MGSKNPVSMYAHPTCAKVKADRQFGASHTNDRGDLDKEILVVSLYYWPEKAGSAPPIQQMAEALARSGAKVKVITARPAYPEMRIHPDYADGERDHERHQGVTITRFPIASYSQRKGTFGRFVTEGRFAIRAFWYLLGRRAPDVAIAVCPSILTVGAVWLSSPTSTRRLAIVHDLQSGLASSLQITRHAWLIFAIRWLERIALSHFDRVVTLTHPMAKAMRDIGVTTPISIVPPTVDDQLIRPMPEAPGPITLLYSGNIGRKQGLEQLLELAARLHDMGRECEVVIRGDGNYRETLQKLAQRRAFSNLRFEPFAPAKEMSEALARGHIHLVPQNPATASFSVPSKIYSIMAAGRPFVCTAERGSAIDGLRRASDAFVLCSPNEPNALLRAVEPLISNSAERGRLGKNGRAFVERYAGKAACASRYRELVTGVEITGSTVE